MKIRLVILLILGVVINLHASEHPSLIITKAGVERIREQLGTIPKFDASLAATRELVDAEMAKGIIVPVPKDLAGGYSHEVHKNNFFIVQKAGVLFQITGEEKYAEYIRDMFLAYAELFPTVGRHPATRSYAPGKFFWQCLNDANWLVYTSQAYDCIYDWLDKKTRKKLNNELFRPMADFLSIETPQFFNRIHNHSTWGNAAVGMIGLVMEDEVLIHRALYGLNTGIPEEFERDNDGGLISLPGKDKTGFMAQIDHSFSPDGYYTEGPYYQRYAIYPFLIFAQALANTKPELKIFEYRDGVLLKGVYALLDLTNANGEFFPINDAQKGMSVLSRELITAVSLAYYFGGHDDALLPYIAMQDRVPLNDTGVSAAIGLKDFDMKTKIVRKSVEVTDGANGDEGGIGVLRSNVPGDELSVIMKYAKHGMGHGHFDELSFFMYLNGDEVIQDYGSARWVNIEQKDGGGYLKENKTWAKQTIAHNTVTLNMSSQYKANVKNADEHHAEPYLFKVDNADVQVMSAKENNAYSDVKMHRTMAMINTGVLEYPLILDIYQITTNKEHSYDLPLWFQGHVMTTNYPYQHRNNLTPMGSNFGYQHLWLEAAGAPQNDISQMSWFNGYKFFTVSSVATDNDSLLFVRLGANDNDYHLRSDPGFIIRREHTAGTTFVNTIETHGSYSTVSEIGKNTYSSIKNIAIDRSDEKITVVLLELKSGEQFLFSLCNNDPGESSQHTINYQGENYSWQGAFKLFKLNN